MSKKQTKKQKQQARFSERHDITLEHLYDLRYKIQKQLKKEAVQYLKSRVGLTKKNYPLDYYHECSQYLMQNAFVTKEIKLMVEVYESPEHFVVLKLFSIELFLEAWRKATRK